MSFADYSTDPNANTSLAGINVAENCAAGNLNNAIRQLAADGKALATAVAAINPGMSTGGGTFTGDIYRSGRGAYLGHASGSLTDGQVFMLPEGSALPAAAEGRIVFFYR